MQSSNNKDQQRKATQPDVQTSVGYLFSAVAMRWSHAAREALESSGISPSQYVMLCGIVHLSTADEVVTQTTLSRHVGMDQMAVSMNVRTLEEKGMVQRQVHPTDSRARLLLVTRKGLSVLKQAQAAVAVVDETVFTPATAEKLRKHLLPLVGWQG
ncbi:MAG: winged helix-turn-helix transcriptional regulator [Bradyrhizobiaceae bacterium]|nr:winged helix-turn-helix transcriptional regulator [Bradyrhizobiaceae bacterium]